MTACLPPNLLALFAPRDPIPYLPPVDKTLAEKKRAGYAGVGAFLAQFEHPKDAPAPVRVESKEERKIRKKKERQEMMTYKLEQELARWTPNENSEAASDPYKTLFIARLNYDTSESKLRREFEQYGAITSVKMVADKNSGKSKGYAFVEFENERDMHAAYKHGDGKRIDGRRIIVDVERGRTVKGWKPRRLGGGRGGRKTGATDPVAPGVRNSVENDRPPAGGPIRNDRDRDGDRNRDRDAGRPYGERPPFNNRGGDGYQDRNNRPSNFNNRGNGEPIRDQNSFRDRGDNRGDRDRDRYNNPNNSRERDRERDRGGDRDRDDRRRRY